MSEAHVWSGLSGSDSGETVGIEITWIDTV